VADDVLRITRTDWGVRFVLERPQKLNALRALAQIPRVARNTT